MDTLQTNSVHPSNAPEPVAFAHPDILQKQYRPRSTDHSIASQYASMRSKLLLRRHFPLTFPLRLAYRTPFYTALSLHPSSGPQSISLPDKPGPSLRADGSRD